MTQLEKLTAFAESLAYCPCCEGVRECLAGCTIAEDSKVCYEGQRAYEIMVAAREALKEVEK